MLVEFCLPIYNEEKILKKRTCPHFIVFFLFLYLAPTTVALYILASKTELFPTVSKCLWGKRGRPRRRLFEATVFLFLEEKIKFCL